MTSRVALREWASTRLRPVLLGVLLLLGFAWIVFKGNAIPFIVVAVAGLAYYEVRRRKNAQLNQR